MQLKKSKKLFTVTVEFANGMTKTVKTKAVDLEHAEARALKFNPSAKGIKRA